MSCILIFKDIFFTVKHFKKERIIKQQIATMLLHLSDKIIFILFPLRADQILWESVLQDLFLSKGRIIRSYDALSRGSRNNRKKFVKEK